MRKILVIGSGGAGKSTLATQLGRVLGLPVIDLDDLYWQPGRKAPSQEAWKQRIAELAQQECWIMDGDYSSTLEERVQACDTVIVLAVPRLLCLYRVLKRAIHKRVRRFRGQARPDLRPEEPKQGPDWPFLFGIWKYPKTRLPRLLELLRAYQSQKHVVILRSPSEVRRFLATMTHPMVARHGTEKAGPPEV